MQNPAIWNNRWRALATTLDEMIKAYNNLSNPTFVAMATCLKVFGGEQLEFFLTGFEKKHL